MKILQINSVSGYGSTGRIVDEIGQKIREVGGESYIAYGRKTGREKADAIRIGSEWSCRMHGLLTRMLDRHGLGSGWATQQLIHTIRRLQPDVIHLHNLHGYYLNIEILFNYLSTSAIPIVWTLHDCWAITGHCTHFAFCGCQRWQTGCYDCPQRKDYPASLWVDRSVKNYNLKKKLFTTVPRMTIVPVSDWLGDIVKQSFLENYPVKVIHNGIDLDIFKPVVGKIREKYGIDDRFMILGVANDWDKRKGWNDFLELSRKIDPKKYILVLVGLTSQQMQELPQEVVAVERTANTHELAEFYSAADVFVNLTWEDTYPTTNLEAIACGTPVVTYRTGGSVEAVTEETGYVIEQGDLSSLLVILEKLKVKGREFYRNPCRLQALRFYGKSECYEKYIELYKQEIERNV